MRTPIVENNPDALKHRAFQTFRHFRRKLTVLFLPWIELRRKNRELHSAFEDFRRYSEDLYSQFRKAQDNVRSRHRRDVALLRLDHETQIAELEQKHLKKIADTELEFERRAYEQIVAAQIDINSDMEHIESVYQSAMDQAVVAERAKYATLLDQAQSSFEKAVEDQGTRHRRRLAKFHEEVDSMIGEVIDIADTEREDQLEQIKLEYENQLERQDDKYRVVVSRKKATNRQLFEDFLPQIKLVKDSSEKLTSSNVRRRIFVDLRTINDRPQEARGERVKMTEWRELRPSKTDRVYYRRAHDSKPYLVLIGNKKSQPRDIEWMRKN